MNQSDDLDERIQGFVEAFSPSPLTRAEADAFVAALSAHLGLEGLVLDEHGIAPLRIDGQLDLHLTHAPHLPGILVYAPFYDLPSDDIRLSRPMLMANMSWPLTRGGIFSLMPGTDQPALFWLLLIRDRRIRDIDRELAEMAECVHAWRQAFASGDGPSVPAQPAPGVPPHQFIRV